jgi:hypothetical protein
VEKDQFYEQLGRTYIQCPSYNIQITDDFNVKVGKESCARKIVEGHSSQDKNNGNSDS